MSYNPEIHHGAAEYLAWKQLNSADANAIIRAETVTPDEYSPKIDDRYAMLVHVVNQSGGGGGGGGGSVTVNTTALEALVGITNTNLQTVIANTADLDGNTDGLEASLTELKTLLEKLVYVQNNNNVSSLSVQDFETRVETTYNRKVYTDVGTGPNNTDILYICHAPHGTVLTAPKWRVEKVFDNGTRYFPNTDGPAFTHSATDLVAVKSLGYLE